MRNTNFRARALASRNHFARLIILCPLASQERSTQKQEQAGKHSGLGLMSLLLAQDALWLTETPTSCSFIEHGVHIWPSSVGVLAASCNSKSNALNDIKAASYNTNKKNKTLMIRLQLMLKDTGEYSSTYDE